MRRRKREVSKTLNTIARREDRKRWESDCELRKKDGPDAE